jgi:FXSXX-COOH protein
VLGDEELGALSRMLRRVRAEAGDIRPRTSTFNNA